MSKIKSKWSKQEVKIHVSLLEAGIDHHMHPNIKGRPDLILQKTKVAVYLHGCFWHKCKDCYKEPKTNAEYWSKKIETNVKRDKINSEFLIKSGYHVKIIWEHEIKANPQSVLLELYALSVDEDLE